MAAVTTTLSSPDIMFHVPSAARTKDSVMPDTSNLSNGYTISFSMKESTPLKLCHVAAVHSKNRTSCLSHDSAETPSFLGFRNLMVIVLSAYLSHIAGYVLPKRPWYLVLIAIVVMNLRLVIENFQKVCKLFTVSSMQEAKDEISTAFLSAFAVTITVATTFSSASSSTPSCLVVYLWPTSSSLPLPIKLEALSVVPNASRKIRNTAFSIPNPLVPHGSS